MSGHLPPFCSSNFLCPFSTDDEEYNGSVGIGNQQGSLLFNNPSQNQDPETLLTREMNSLSVQERSEALADLHCVGEETEPEPELP